MKYLFIPIVLFPVVVFAQTATNSIGTAAQSGSYSGVNNNFASSPSEQTIRSAPAISPPTMYTMSTCSTPVSGGVSIIGFGASGGTVISSKTCEQEQEDAIYVPLLGKLGYNDIAMALLCENKDIQTAALTVNTPCPKVTTPVSPVITNKFTTPISDNIPSNCHQIFVSPKQPNGAGYMKQVCN